MEKHVAMVEQQVDMKQRRYEQLTYRFSKSSSSNCFRSSLSALEAEQSFLSTMDQVAAETKKKQEHHVHGECIKLDVAIKEVGLGADAIHSTLLPSEDDQYWLFQAVRQLEHCKTLDNKFHEQLQVLFNLVSNPVRASQTSFVYLKRILLILTAILQMRLVLNSKN